MLLQIDYVAHPEGKNMRPPRQQQQRAVLFKGWTADFIPFRLPERSLGRKAESIQPWTTGAHCKCWTLL